MKVHVPVGIPLVIAVIGAGWVEGLPSRGGFGDMGIQGLVPGGDVIEYGSEDSIVRHEVLPVL